MKNAYPQAIGPYSAYRMVKGVLYISGQLPLDPQSGEILSENIQDQTKASLKNLEGILKENQMGFENVIKTTVFLADINDFAQMNEVYSTFFKSPYPARSAFAVKDLPRGARVEIEAIASKE